jgi:ATP-dependent RNA helicase HelY
MAGTRPRYPRSKRKYQNKRTIRHGKLFYNNCRLDPALKKTFKKIGVPEPAPFQPDSFQLEALEKIRDFDVLVSAPTGSGKTWIATRAIEQNLLNGLRTWYASPLKALSNSLYQEFIGEFGANVCGILTGERKENPDAPIIVGTTEILRNQLYDSMHEGTSLDADLVILDEAHYLSDPDRGVVWEEVLIYLPPRVRLLLLSATISNAEELCGWLMKNRKTKAHVVRAHERPVPLETLFLFTDGLISPLAGKKGLSPRVKKFVSANMSRGKIRGQGRPRFNEILSCLRKFNLLPAIFFLKSRMDCDHALELCDYIYNREDVKKKLKNDVNDFIGHYPHLKGHRHLEFLTESLVASHHAGQLPYWKILIEKMMNRGYLEAIFSTSTVAAGVNFPARTVVLVQSDRFNGYTFTDLTSTDLHQMTGRAGRRGMDNIGFALVIPGLHQNPRLINELMGSTPESLVSRIHINFSMTLNLLLSHTPLEIKTLLDLSFANFQQKSKTSLIDKKWNDIISSLKKILPNSNCDNSDPYEVMEYINERSELKKQRRKIGKTFRNKRFRRNLQPYLEKGRIFRHRDKSDYILFHTYLNRGRFICASLNINKKVRLKKGKVPLKKVPVEKIDFLYNTKVDIHEDRSLSQLQAILDDIDVKEFEIINMEEIYRDDRTEIIRNIDDDIKSLPCNECDAFNECDIKRNKDLRNLFKDFVSLESASKGGSQALWLSFKRHVRFLKTTGFVDESNRLSPDGIWASKLRLDQPLLIAEAIRKGGFKDSTPEVLAGCIALFVWDRDQEVTLKTRRSLNITVLEDAFNRLINSMEDIIRLKEQKGFENAPIMFWPGAAVYLWAKDISWDELMDYAPIGEGDMASLIIRTADHLRQVKNLKETHPQLASIAKQSIDLILREPVLIS